MKNKLILSILVFATTYPVIYCADNRNSDEPSARMNGAELSLDCGYSNKLGLFGGTTVGIATASLAVTCIRKRIGQIPKAPEMDLNFWLSLLQEAECGEKSIGIIFGRIETVMRESHNVMYKNNCLFAGCIASVLVTMVSGVCCYDWLCKKSLTTIEQNKPCIERITKVCAGADKRHVYCGISSSYEVDIDLLRNTSSSFGSWFLHGPGNIAIVKKSLKEADKFDRTNTLSIKRAYR